jgi:hypothetical protein
MASRGGLGRWNREPAELQLSFRPDWLPADLARARPDRQCPPCPVMKHFPANQWPGHRSRLTCHLRTQKGGLYVARPRWSQRCAVVGSRSRRLAVSTSCRRKNYCRGNARSKSMAFLVCVRPAFNNIAGLVVRESLSLPLNPRVESSRSRWATLPVVSHTRPRSVGLVAGSRRLGGFSR